MGRWLLMGRPDIVYVVRQGDRNEELRYSLRSLANLPHGKVWISGYKPVWVSDEVGHIKTQVKPGGHVHAKGNLRAACEHPEVAEQFVYMNDDFFFMAPLEQMPVMHRGPLSEVIKSERMASSYQRAMGKTLDILRKHGIAEPLMYDLHGPMLVTKTGMLEALALCSYPMIQERTIYGNLQGIGGELRRNHKVRRGQSGWNSWQFLSTNDNTFRTMPIGEHIRAKFPDQSAYETDPPAAKVRVPPTSTITRRPIRRRSGVSTIQRVSVRGAY
jgi:hypothetical protein